MSRFRLTPAVRSGKPNKARRASTRTVWTLRSSFVERVQTRSLPQTLAALELWCAVREAEMEAYPETGGAPPFGGSRVLVDTGGLSPGAQDLARRLSLCKEGKD